MATVDLFGNPLRIAAVRRDAETTAAADGESHPLYSNEFGRVKVSSQPAALDATVGDITAIQPTATTPVAAGTVAANVARASNVMVQMTGTFAGINLTFEVSLDGGVTWIGTQAVRSNSNTIEAATGALSAAPAYGWELSVNACTHVRVRATARTSGTATIRILPGVFATEPIPAMQTHAVTGSGTFNVASASTLNVQETSAATLTTNTQITTSTTSVTLAALLATRKHVVVYNTGTSALLVSFAATATAANAVRSIPAGDYWVIPRELWTGIVTGIGTAAGTANITVTS